MEPGGSLPHSQEPATCRYPEPGTGVVWVPVTTAWRVLRPRLEERLPVMEGSCEYIA
jgi:hypothetical protein